MCKINSIIFKIIMNKIVERENPLIISIAIVDDNLSFIKLFKMVVENIEINGLELVVTEFDNPLNYKSSGVKFDFVIMDCIFRGYPSDINGLKLARDTLLFSPRTKIILTTEFGESELGSVILDSDRDKNIEFYGGKNIGNYEFLEKINKCIQEVRQAKLEILKLITVKFHVYKSGKEEFKFLDINYAQTDSRENHTIIVGTTKKIFNLSITVNAFIDRLNKSLMKKQINLKQIKIRSDLYVNKFNVLKIDEAEQKIYFKDGNHLILKNTQNIDLVSD